jgi:hypothetical protein
MPAMPWRPMLCVAITIAVLNALKLAGISM